MLEVDAPQTARGEVKGSERRKGADSKALRESRKKDAMSDLQRLLKMLALSFESC
jgi:hypothetical protein